MTDSPIRPPAETLRAIGERWGLDTAGVGLDDPPLPGVFNHVWFLGERLVLRVARPDPDSVAVIHNEAAVIPLARRAGVRTAGLVAFDPSPELLGAPYLVLERVPGDNLGVLALDPRATPEAYRALGRDLARWHARPTGPVDPLRSLVRDPNPDLRPVVDRLVAGGQLGLEAARWLANWLDRLAPDGLVPVEPRVVHGDASPTNVLVTPGAAATWPCSTGATPLGATPPPTSPSCHSGPCPPPSTATARPARRRRGGHRGPGPLVPPRLGAAGPRPATTAQRVDLDDPAGGPHP